MKLIDYYIAAFIPILIIVLLSISGFSKTLVPSIMIYYVYRCFLDYYKLKKNGVVGKKDVWKFIIPLWTFLYFRQIYFK